MVGDGHPRRLRASTPSDLPRIVEAKRNLLQGSGCLESITVNFDVDEIGGLATLKAWLARRRGGMTPAAREFGLDPPRGILLLGVQGCGKSLCAKAVAADWQMPLLADGPGRALPEVHRREREPAARGAAQAEAMAPVVLWIDEIEKAFASAVGRVGRRRASSADVRHAAVVDAGPPQPDLHGGDGEQHRGAAAGADAQGPVRRGLLRGPAARGGPAEDPRASTSPGGSATPRSSTWTGWRRRPRASAGPSSSSSFCRRCTRRSPRGGADERPPAGGGDGDAAAVGADGRAGGPVAGVGGQPVRAGGLRDREQRWF